ncbi:MAG: hypothetical protein CFH08_00816 [Alphaproteobacteria bacterium MarineAlpha3_Bin7]|nr:MAG: hypothetical protein CFH08_00816 [Alphaproteobacteria bacterium MarineAlpha3_Bin7]
MEVTEEIEAPFFYLKDTSKTPINRQTNTAKDTNDFRATRDPTVMKIKNGRLLATDPSLDREGFAFLKQVSKVVNFFDDSELNTIYSLEIEDLIRRASGGREVVVFDHTRRSTAPEQREKYNARDPVPAPHSDYSDTSAEQRMHDVFGKKVSDRLNRRFAMVNAWRSMTGTIEEWPIAVCDARTVNENLLVDTYRHAPHRAEPSFEYARSSSTRHAAFDSSHRWYYYPEMKRDEVLLFKNYDTLKDGTARFALHSAFEDPSTPQNPKPRESIETRAFVFFD